MVDQELVSTLVQTVLIAGPTGSAGYNAALAQLKADAAAARAKLSSGFGKQLVGMSAGSAATWAPGTTIQDLAGAYTQALMRLNSMVPIVRITSGRFFE
jgi:hypothetical protein